ncbi:MAG: DinB family protein [Thermoanaerobaculia bacterium]|nr:DinB family protein [Thermoanaerobaculia bacterium]
MDIERRIEAFDRERIALLDELASLDPARLTARSIPGKWSILEIVEHLVLGEELVYGGLPDPGQLRQHRRRLKNRFFYLLVMVLLRFGVRLKAPSKALLPRGEGSFEQYRQRWDRNQKWLSTYAGSLSPEELRRAVFIHPATGPIDVVQVVDMTAAHFHTHLRQIRALQKLLEEERQAI